MKISIKLLERDPLLIEVTSDTTIRSIKQQLFQYLKIPIENQKLIFNGQILQNEEKLKCYSEIHDNSKIHLIVIVKKNHPLYEKVYKIIRPHYSEKETQKILSIFMRKMYQSFQTLSLDDLERIAQDAMKAKNSGNDSVVEKKLHNLD